MVPYLELWVQVLLIAVMISAGILLYYAMVLSDLGMFDSDLTTCYAELVRDFAVSQDDLDKLRIRLYNELEPWQREELYDLSQEAHKQLLFGSTRQQMSRMLKFVTSCPFKTKKFIVILKDLSTNTNWFKEIANRLRDIERELIMHNDYTIMLKIDYNVVVSEP